MFKHLFATAAAETNEDNNASVNEDAKKKEGGEDSKKVLFSREIASLKYELGKKEREVAERAEVSQRVVKRTHGIVTTYSSLESMYGEVDNEINVVLQKTPWKRLADNYKWKFIKEYIEGLDILNKNDKKVVLRKCKSIYKTLGDVEYDMVAKRVGKLNWIVHIDETQTIAC